MTRRDAERVRDETSGIGPGSSGRRDGVGTGCGTSHNTNKGYHPNLTVHPECDLASARTCDFVTDLDKLHQELQKHILDAQHRYQLSANSRRLPAPEFKTGSQAFVKAQFFCMTQPSKKLSEKFLGLYCCQRTISYVIIRIKLLIIWASLPLLIYTS